ncbi:MAG: CbtA family protein [Halobacteriota archaeon]|uniref:CbtA family protein n=1 Tax=Natronomonas sp. TaxID=2184060 RepID=UPI0039752E2C
MLFSHLRRGLLVGVGGGIAYGIFTLLVVTPLVSLAESFEPGHQGHQEATTSVVSETTTVVVSVGGGILWGIFLGILTFGAVYYFFEPAIPGVRGTKSYLLGMAGFITVSGSPWLVLPPLPPGVEQTVPTSARVLWYVIFAGVGLLACGTAGYVYNYVRDNRGRLSAYIVAGGPFLILIGVTVVAPENSTSSELPAQFITAYQGIVAFGQIGLWFILASLHAWMFQRAGPTTERDVSTERPESFNIRVDDFDT